MTGQLLTHSITRRRSLRPAQFVQKHCLHTREVSRLLFGNVLPQVEAFHFAMQCPPLHPEHSQPQPSSAIAE